MTARSETRNPLSKLIREPLEKISREISAMIKISQEISEMVESPYKTEQLEKLATTHPAYETIAAKIKRANDFYTFLQVAVQEKLSIEYIFQILNAQSKEKQDLYEKFENEYKTFFKSLMTSANQITHLDKDYLEREYLEKLKTLSQQLDSNIEFLKEKIQVFRVRIKEINQEIKNLEVKINQNKEDLIEAIDELCDINSNKQDIEKLIINVSIYNENGEPILNATEDQDSVALEFWFDKNLDKCALANLLQTAIDEGKLDKDDLINQLKSHITHHADNQIKPLLVDLDLPEKERLDFILKIPEMEKFIANRAQTTFEEIEQSPRYSTFSEKFNKHESIIKQREDLLEVAHQYQNQVEIYKSDIKKLTAMKDNAIQANAKIKNLSTLALNDIQKSMQSATETITTTEKNESSAMLANKAINTSRLETEEKSHTPRTPRRRAT